MSKTIAVAGVGLSLAVLLAQHNKVHAVSTTPANYADVPETLIRAVV